MQSVNLIPFTTIVEYLHSILRGNKIIGISNLLGNLILFLGKAVIDRLHGFGCRVLAYNRSRDAGCVTLNELFERSDIVTLHAPLNTDTYHMLGREQIEIMKRGAFLVNTGRGALVDTDELIKALEIGKLGGAALDVLEPIQNLLSSKAIKAKTTICKLVCRLRSQFFQSLRHLSSQPKVLSTTHRLGRTTN